MSRTIVLALLSLALVAAIIYQPGDAFAASLQGLTVWWTIVFPGLLPFFTLLELMMALGVVHGFGTLLEPVTRRVLRLPGESALALVTGWLGGFPAGAEATAALRQQNLVTRQEGQHLLAFSHMPNPLFMLLVVGAGFFRRPELGLAIAISLWLACIITALLFRFRHAASEAGNAASVKPGPSPLRRAANAMNDARIRDGRSFGKVLGDSVTISVAKLMAVGGFMMLASVVVQLLNSLMSQPFLSLLIPGLLESHLGAYTASLAKLGIAGADVPWQAAFAAAFLAWGGICALLQAGNAIARTDLSLIRLALSRLFQAALAFIIALFAAEPIANVAGRLMKSAAPALFQQTANQDNYLLPVRASDLPAVWPYVPAILLSFGFIVLLLAGIAFVSATKRTPSN
ncbi:nucleoside recognition domain-containing protein [Paenibacillus sp. GCM10027626]|uniref:nucleoside recognition domain-containing protein n=1 Tax=Paenibacillus sp. GCM10027626 TaxID=3273411 RepID=UPI00363E679A